LWNRRKPPSHTLNPCAHVPRLTCPRGEKRPAVSPRGERFKSRRRRRFTYRFLLWRDLRSLKCS
ncbi:MAG: hypothetical protein ACK55Z_08660, partial [bacterium]